MTPPTALSMYISWSDEEEQLAQGTDFWAHVSVHAWSWRFAVGKSWAKHGMQSNIWQNMVRAAMGENTCTTLAITYVFTQIISENTCHRHTIDFHHGYRGIGSYFRQAEDKGRCLPANHVIWRLHTQFSSAEKSKLFIVLRIKHITCPAVQTTEHGGWRVRTARIA